MTEAIFKLLSITAYGDMMKKPMYFEGMVAILLILLCFVMYLMLTGNTITSSPWQVTGSGPVSSVQLGSDGTLYAFAQASGNDIYAIGSDGKLKWNYQIPSQWCVSTVITLNLEGDGITGSEGPVYASDNGTLYLYVRQNNTHSHSFTPVYDWQDGITPDGTPSSSEVMAISPDGKLLWTAVIGDYYWTIGNVNVYAKNGRIYAFTGYNLTVLDTSGKQLFRLDNVSDPPTVDDNGYIYVSRSGPSYMFEESYAVKDPSGVIDAYYPNGTLYWSKTMKYPISRPEFTDNVGQKYGFLPLYQNDTLYVPLRNGIIALYTNGSVKWSQSFDGGVYQLSATPIDSHGNIFLLYHKPPPPPMMGPDADTYTLFLKVIDSNGNVIIDREPYNGGIVNPLNDYAYSPDGDVLAHPSMKPTLYNIVTYRITAFDLLNNRSVWEFTIPIGQTREVILDANNVKTLFHPATAESLAHDNQDMANSSFMQLNQTYVSWPQLTILAGNDVVYVSYLTSNLEVPPVFGKARCVYTNNMYAIDNNGTLLWSLPLDSFVTSIAVNNSTIYYGMSNGGVSVGQTSSIAGGIAIVALLYVFFKFFLAGSVSRARKLLDKNVNRNAVYDFILRNPGSTLYDISRALGMNIGTTRYHLYILGMNHRIVTHYTGIKYVRYFTNAGSYSKEEQVAVSLVRRDVMRKILELLIEKPGQSNIQISQALDMPESSVSKYMKELSANDIVIKAPMFSGTYAFSIKDEHHQSIIRALERTT